MRSTTMRHYPFTLHLTLKPWIAGVVLFAGAGCFQTIDNAAASGVDLDARVQLVQDRRIGADGDGQRARAVLGLGLEVEPQRLGVGALRGDHRQLARPVEPVDPVDPVEPVEPVDPVDPVEPLTAVPDTRVNVVGGLSFN